MMSFRRMLCGPALIAGLALVAPSRAVEVNRDGLGQVLILPVWTTTGGHSTLLNIQSLNLMAAKLRVLGGDGSLLFSGNLYFRQGNDSWTAGIGPDPGGGSLLSSSDTTCLLVSGEDGVEALSGPISLPADHGSIEVIGMGVPAHADGVDPNVVFQIEDEFAQSDCDALAARWNSGNWSESPAQALGSPDPILAATWSIIQVERGTLYQVPGTALANYSDQVQHTSPGDALPNLASGHDAGTDEGKTVSRVCDSTMECSEDTWATPLDAVAAALLMDSYRGDFIIDPNLGAATDLIITYPLAPYFAERDGPDSTLAKAHVRMDSADRDGTSRTGTVCPSPSPPHVFCDGTYMDIEQPAPMLKITFNPEQEPSADLDILSDWTSTYIPPATPVEPSGVLGLPATYRLEKADALQYPDGTVSPLSPLPPLPPAGTFFVALQYYWNAADLVGNSGKQYFGAPALPVVFQQYVNGTLPGPDEVAQRANYGMAFRPAGRGAYTLPPGGGSVPHQASDVRPEAQ
ncbi:MAG: hypothetical protein R3F22_12540 [Lysobacteraceae bacterium]